MTISSYPFEDADTTESQFSALFRELQDSGVCDSATGTALRVQVGAGSSVDILAGSAILRGFLVDSDATENRALAGPDAQPRKDRVVARLDPSANEITLVVKPGTPGDANPPALTESLTGTFEIALATATMATSGTVTVTDERRFVGQRVGVWNNATRPTANTVRVGKLGFNVDTLAYEYSDGAAWVALKPALVDQATKWGPGSGYRLVVSTTTPAGTPDPDRIWIQPTA